MKSTSTARPIESEDERKTNPFAFVGTNVWYADVLFDPSPSTINITPTRLCQTRFLSKLYTFNSRAARLPAAQREGDYIAVCHAASQNNT